MPKGVYNHKPLLEQHRKNISKAKKATGSGSNNPFYGKTHSDEQRKKWKTTRKGQKPWNTGKHHLLNEKHWNWKGGISLLRKRIRGLFKYRQWRSDIFTRDNFTCVLCGKSKCYVEADHYPKLFSEIIKDNNIKTIEEASDCEEFWNINNGRTLCKDCHKKVTYGN